MKLKLLLIILLFVSSLSEAQKIDEKNKISYEDISSNESIDYNEIETPPSSLNCKKRWNKKKKKECTLNYILSHFAKQINISELAENFGLSGITQIEIEFIIDKQGDITNIQINAPHKEIEKELTKVVSTLEKFNPGSENGFYRNVSMSIPLKFKVE